jgi:hypothetical protein
VEILRKSQDADAGTEACGSLKIKNHGLRLCHAWRRVTNCQLKRGSLEAN